MKTARWKLSDVFFAAFALLLFLLPAALNRSPILYPDTVGYFQAGRAATNAVHLRLPMPAPSPAAIPAPATPPAEGAKLGIDTADGVSDARSVYYGAAFVVAWSLFGLWAIPLLQAAVCVLAITLRCATWRQRRRNCNAGPLSQAWVCWAALAYSPPR